MMRVLSSFRSDERGNVLILTGLLAPLLIGFAGLTIDVGHAYYSKARLQGAAEAAALSFAESLTASHHAHPADIGRYLFGPKSPANYRARALEIGRSNLPAKQGARAILDGDFELFEWDPTGQQLVPFDSSQELLLNAVKVDAELSADRGNAIPVFFASLFGFRPDLRSTAYAAAPFVPNFHILNSTKGGAFTIDFPSDMDVHSLWVNSSSRQAYVGPSGFHGHPGNGVSITIMDGETNSPERDVWGSKFHLPDLLAEQKLPGRGLFCDYQDELIEDVGHVTLDPGVFCGGLTVRNVGEIHLSPGVYTFVDGPLHISDKSRINGSDVLLHFDGPNAVLDIDNSRMSISGLQSGEFRGLAITSDRGRYGNQHRISNMGRTDISGTVYLPSDAFFIENGRLDGTCHTLCFVADTLAVTSKTGTNSDTRINWFPAFSIPFAPAEVTSAPRLAPEALEPYLRPYLIYPE